jgi:hypothetical protein
MKKNIRDTIGCDLGDKMSAICMLDTRGRVVPAPRQRRQQLPHGVAMSQVADTAVPSARRRGAAPQAGSPPEIPGRNRGLPGGSPDGTAGTRRGCLTAHCSGRGLRPAAERVIVGRTSEP